MNLQGLLESHGSWPSQASACGRAALGRLTHPRYCPRNNGTMAAGIINRKVILQQLASQLMPVMHGWKW